MNNVENVVYTVSDLAAAKAIHAALLGADPHTETPYYVGFDIAGFEIGLTPQAAGASTGAVAHVNVTDLEATLDRVLDAGAALASEPRQVAPGTRVATVTDPDGITLGLIEHAPGTS